MSAADSCTATVCSHDQAANRGAVKLRHGVFDVAGRRVCVRLLRCLSRLLDQRRHLARVREKNYVTAREFDRSIISRKSARAHRVPYRCHPAYDRR